MADFDLTNAVMRAQSGDATAFDAVAEKTQRMAKSYAHRISRDESAAEDAIQDAYLQAWRDLSKLNAPEAFVSWLKRLIFKYCDRITRSARPAFLLDETLFDLAGCEDFAHDPFRRMSAFGESLEIRRAIESLPARQRESILLYYHQDYDIGEIADLLELPRSTIKNRLCVARKRLRRELWFMDAQLNEGSREREIRQSIMSEILDDFKTQRKRDPLTADYGLIDQGRLAFLDLLEKGREISSEEMRNGRFFLRQKGDFGVCASALSKYMSQNLSVEERVWAYCELIGSFVDADFGKIEIGRCYGGASILAFEEFEKAAAGEKIRNRV